MYIEGISQLDEKIYALCAGNPGALSFIVKAYHESSRDAEYGFNRMAENGITGSRLYMLWNDCCERDTRQVLDVMLYDTIQSVIDHINDSEGRGIVYTAKDMQKIMFRKMFDKPDQCHGRQYFTDPFKNITLHACVSAPFIPRLGLVNPVQDNERDQITRYVIDKLSLQIAEQITQLGCFTIKMNALTREMTCTYDVVIVDPRTESGAI